MIPDVLRGRFLAQVGMQKAASGKPLRRIPVEDEENQ